MSTAEVAAPAAASAHGRPWWRGRFGVVVVIALAMLIAFLGWKTTDVTNWPGSLVWNSLGGYLDRFQVWLSDNRNVPDPSFVFSIFNGFANFLDNLVSWLTSFFHRLTWPGRRCSRPCSCSASAAGARRPGSCSRSGRSR